MAFPDVSTLIDDFNRANGALHAGAGATIWSNLARDQPGGAWEVSSNVAQKSASGTSHATLGNYGPSLDVIYTAAAGFSSTRYTGLFVRASGAGTSAISYDALLIGRLSVAHRWELTRVDAGNFAPLINIGSQAVAPGDKVGMSLRGSQISAWYKSPAGSWTQIGSTRTDATYATVSGPIIFESTAVNPIDDLSGGTYVAITAAALAATDTGAGTDTATLGVAVTPLALAATDTGAGTDTATLGLAVTPVTLAVADAGAGADIADLGFKLDYAVRILTSKGWQDLAIQGPPGIGYYSTNQHPAGTTISIPQATHGLRATRGLSVTVHNDATGAQEVADVTVSTGGAVTVTFVSPAAANSKRITIMGPPPNA